MKLQSANFHLSCPPLHSSNNQGCPNQLQLEANKLVFLDPLPCVRLETGSLQATQPAVTLFPSSSFAEHHVAPRALACLCWHPGTLPNAVPSMRPAAMELPLHLDCRTNLHPGWRTSKQQTLGQHTNSPILIKTPPNLLRAQAANPPPDLAPAGAKKRNCTIPSPASPQPRVGTN